jgi:hypothetical protein
MQTGLALLVLTASISFSLAGIAADPGALKQVQDQKGPRSCPRCDLSGVDFHGEDFTGAIFSTMSGKSAERAGRKTCRELA